MLTGERSRMTRARTHTKPGSLLKHQVPIRTFADWDDALPGSWRSTWSAMMVGEPDPGSAAGVGDNQDG